MIDGFCQLCHLRMPFACLSYGKHPAGDLVEVFLMLKQGAWIGKAAVALLPVALIRELGHLPA